jgi:HAD superfamily hydrolase (TIGR01509 family)
MAVSLRPFEMTLHAASALVFDCDGTLVDSEAIHADALWHALREVGIHVEPQLLQDRFIGVDNPTILEWVTSTVKSELPEDFDARMERHTDLAVRERVRAIAGANEVIRSFSEARVPLAVASNSNLRTVEAMLRGAGLMTYFEGHIASRDKVQCPKPAPDIYRLAARMLGVVPAACLAVEDSVPGVRSARAAGMSVIGFCPAGDHSALVDAGAELVVCRLIDLLNLDLKFHTRSTLTELIAPS